MTTKRLITALLSKIPIIIIVTIISGVAGGYINYNIVPEKYTSYSTFYVLEKTNPEEEGKDSTSYTDLRLSELLVADYNELATSKRVKNKVASNLGFSSLSGYKISVSSKENTRVMKLTVIGEDRETATQIANEMVKVFSETVIDIMSVENVNIVDYAEVPKSPSSPAKSKNTILCTAAGAVITCGVVLLIELLNNTIKRVEEIEETLNLPVLAQIGRFRGAIETKDDESSDDKRSAKKRRKAKKD